MAHQIARRGEERVAAELLAPRTGNSSVPLGRPDATSPWHWVRETSSVAALDEVRPNHAEGMLPAISSSWVRRVVMEIGTRKITHFNVRITLRLRLDVSVVSRGHHG